MSLKVSHTRCKCPTCGLFFNSIAGFDKHRKGNYSEGRICLSEPEMLSIGMDTSEAGYWLTAKNTQQWGSPESEGDSQNEPSL